MNIPNRNERYPGPGSYIRFSEFGVLDPNYKKRRIETEPSKRTEEIKNEETKEDKIYTYDPLYTKDSRQIIKPLCESYDGSNITCVKPFGKNSLESQKVIFGTEKEGINIYDQRMKKYSY